ncbi:hypothetical protein [Tautonia plasticadhaerens]|uniref:Uncharacterized protein n=1 Tax=Tautonia plasticadhaerens TaxID=2527974 RepID=A0A518H6P3_9BACT|nr:hypothetical protein [Tautonia plasticadhaerens]QDV36488.1 hypothetical protein ElP_44140 [Tautonia plasticadhaerens]
MNWRLRDLVRAGAALGLLFSMAGDSARAQEPIGLPPSPELLGETIDILRAQRSGDLAVEARGAGNDRVRLRIKNTSDRRLHVVLPPGLVASAASGQFQSMGLGAPTNQPEAFGRFESPSPAGLPGFQSIPVSGESTAQAVTVPSGEEVSVSLPAVCLNYGLADPKPADRFELLDVSEYSPDARVQRALRSLATYGTGRRVAQVVMWNVCNGLAIPQVERLSPKLANQWELALAGRFVEALDASTSGELVDPAYLTSGRVFVRVQGEGDLADDASRLADALDGAPLLGLPARVVRGADEPTASGPALYLVVTLTSSTDSQTAGRIAVHGVGRDREWTNGGTAKLALDAPTSSVDAIMLGSGIDRAVASKFVTVRSLGNADGGNRLVVENGLPMTLAGLTLDTAATGGALVPFDGIGVGPLRSAEVLVPAASGRVDSLQLNGL